MYIEPHGKDLDSRRREFILNTLLSGLFGIATVALLVPLINAFILQAAVGLTSIWGTAIFWLIIAALLFVSRRGFPQAAAFVFGSFLLVSGVMFALAWSFRLAQVELVFALTIVIYGVLYRASLALAASFVVGVALTVISYLQITGRQVPYTGWQDTTFETADAVGYIAIFAIMGLVSWLSNRETDRSLKRARRSEKALQKERDQLEVKVAERTRELEELQAARLLEMQPFAEFGRIGASLVHDIANPLTAATMHLEELNRQQHSQLVIQVQRSLGQLERYLVAARKQIKRESKLRAFSVGAELKQIVHLLTHRARRAGVQLVIEKTVPMKLYGDAVKFDQLIANLIANAIDASEKGGKSGRQVIVRATEQDGRTVITVTDHGVGITPEQTEHLFEPFYSTKATARRGLGLGLATVKQYVEHDFHGSIEVSSTPAEGTTFTVYLEGLPRS